ncbi:MAG: hypothetical protein V3T83_18570 [Acidobacteriota bacterium]
MLRNCFQLLLVIWIAFAASGRPGRTPLAQAPLQADPLAGDLGEAPSGGETISSLEVRNGLQSAREGEIAFSGIPIPRGLGLTSTDELVVVAPGERRLAAQFDVLSRWDGTVDDTNQPIRWLQVTVPVSVPAGGQVSYSLRRITGLPPAEDPFAAAISRQGEGYRVDTGLATFILDPSNPALFDEIQIDPDDDGQGRTSVYSHTSGAGPRLVFAGQTLDTSNPDRVSVDPGGFEIVERGPVKVVVSLQGHFSAAGGASLCGQGELAYQRFGYSLVATFVRASRDIFLQYHVRNECSDGFSEPWTDQEVTVDQASWDFPFTSLQTPLRYYAGEGEIASANAAAEGSVRVEQLKGGGTPWRRRAQAVVDGAIEQSAEAFDSPLVAVGDNSLIVSAQIPWMRFREPQAVAVQDQTLSLRVISQPLIVGEGKGIWNFAKLSLVPVSGLGQGAALMERLESVRRQGLAELENGLLVRTPLEHFNAAQLFPSLGTSAASAIKTAYLKTIQELHDQTVRPGGQWDRAKTFGSQLWPDVQADLFFDNESPQVNSGAMNYWNPSGAELLEFLRSGDPRWVWDFALAQSWLQMFAAYLNIGEQNQGNRNGFAVTSGGSGEGQWHRSAFGSDDYNYNQGTQLAYALRANPLMRQRFAQAGRTAVERYSISEENQRDQFVSQIDITRQVIQHFEMLANCAEFVPGAQGLACQQRLIEVVSELARDNLKAGVMCQGDAPSTFCPQPQQFMQAAMMFHFFHRYLRNYGDAEGLVERAMVQGPLLYSQFGIPKQADGVSLDVFADWAALLDCTLNPQRTEVVNCVRAANSDGSALLQPNKPHSVALLLMAHELDPSIAQCNAARRAYEDPNLASTWEDFQGNESGWWKGAAQMMQGMIFGVGIADTCSDEPLSNQLFFAQFADGDGLSSQILLFEPQGQPARVNLELRSNDGSPLSVDLNSQSVSGQAALDIPAQGLAVLQSDGLGALQSGSVSVASNRPLAGVIVFGGTTGLAGVGASQRLEDGFLAPLTQDQAQGVRTGLAVMNLEESPLEPRAEIFRNDGTLLAEVVLDPIPAQGNRAVFLDELLPNADLSQFEGLLRMNAEGAMSATVLQTRPSQLATLPVTPLAGGSLELFFAQFADGEGITSQILLFASDPAQVDNANLQLLLRDGDGSPLSVVLNGQAVNGQLSLEIAPQGIVVLQSSGQGALQTGNVTVTSDQPLAGVIVFGGSEGRAGVAGSLALPNGFAAPMQSDAALGIRTGVALMNLEDEQVTVSLELFDRDGVSAATSALNLPPQGSLPSFLDELFPELDLTNFQGTLRATATGRISATALQTRPGQFATLPVANVLP